MTDLYLDTSVAVHAVLPGGDARAVQWARDAADRDTLWSSTLLRLELVRVLRRDDLPITTATPLLDRMSLVSIDDEVLQVAAAIEHHVRSLDAIHLATSLLLGGLPVVTNDERMRRAALSIGLDSFDPITASD